MEKAFEIQKQVRDNAKTFQTYLTDLKNWEAEMKRKEAALNGAFEQDLPPVRSKIKKEKPVVVQKPPAKRIPSSDYKAWDNFDVEKACEEIDMCDIGPVSLDSKKSAAAKKEKLREEAQYEKERGNGFVKQQKWDEAISCYNRAIELIKDDAIFYANRGLCYLKKDSLHQAETDCNEAIRLDPTYVKAYQRRASARERLGSLRAASHDLAEVIKLEPHNKAARQQLAAITARMGTKGVSVSKSKSSPSTTPTSDLKPLSPATNTQKIVELDDKPPPLKPKPKTKLMTELEKWRDAVGEPFTVIKPVKKPPHLRSKKALKSIPIIEISLGEPEKQGTRISIVEEDSLARGDGNNNKGRVDELIGKHDAKGEGDKTVPSPESTKLISDVITTEKVDVKNMSAPVSSVQFMADWKYLKDKGEARSDYLTLIDPTKIPSIFANALESDVLSEILQLLYENKEKYKEKTVTAYLRGLCGVKRFGALVMFLTGADKLVLTNLFEYCKNVENCSDDDIDELKNKFEP